MTDMIQFRSGTAAQWTSSGRVLREGEPGFESDTGRFKIGNGVSAWPQLPYVGSGLDVSSVEELEETLEGVYVEQGPDDNVERVVVNGVLVPPNALALPNQVSPVERTAGTETNLRSFSPEDVALMAGVHGGGGSGGGGGTLDQGDSYPDPANDYLYVVFGTDGDWEAVRWRPSVGDATTGPGQVGPAPSDLTTLRGLTYS